MADAHPPRPQPFRIGSLLNFLPLADDAVSTRGQKLPSIIRDRSTASIRDLRAQFSQLQPSHDEEDVERDGDRRGRERGGNDHSEGQRRASNGSQVLMTPQMRSMRLIGNNNLRYQW